MRKCAVVLAGLVIVGALGGGALWWRLATGSLALDIITPWLVSALEERLGSLHHIEVGGTVLERDDDGRLALRLHDIVVSDVAGAIVASAPKAEVGIAPMSLFTGHLRAERLSLIGAEMALRIEPDGQLRVFAGSAAGAMAVAAASGDPPSTRGIDVRLPAAIAIPAAEAAETPSLLASAVGWLQSLDGVGLDGRDLIEIGLKNGSVAIDDRRTGKKLSFSRINLSLMRLKEGGAALALTSMGTDGPWSINATVTTRGEGLRAIEAVVRDLSPKDILLALRLDAGDFQADVPLSAVIRAEIGPDGVPLSMEGRIIAGAGFIGDAQNEAGRILIDEAQMELRWDTANRLLLVPIEIHAGASRLVLLSQVEPPRQKGGTWSFTVAQGMVALASLTRPQEPPVVLDRLSVRAIFDPANRRVNLEQGDLRGASGGIAMSGTLDYGGSEPLLMINAAGTPMTASAFKRLWPVFVAPQTRSWIDAHLLGGTVERVVIAANVPLRALRPPDVRLAEDALSIEIVSKGSSIRPVAGLPPIKDIELTSRVSGRGATVSFGRGQVDLPSGRKLVVTGGIFEVLEFGGEPTMAAAKFRIEGGIDAAAELLAMEPVRDAAALPFDAGSTRGAVSAQVSLAIPLQKNLQRDSVAYAVEAELTGFSAERFMRGQKGEAALLRASATQNLLLIKGDMKIAGTTAAVEYRKARIEPDAELQIQTVLDDAARVRLGFDFGNALSGPVPIKVTGRMKLADRDSRLGIEADLTQAKVTDLIPGWIKAAGRPARASFVAIDRGQSMRLDDFVLDGSGAGVKGSIELDPQGEILHASFPNFAVSDGDKASLKADRSNDGVLKVVLRGDLYDGRGLVKTAVAGHKPEQRRRPTQDLDLDIKLGAVTGHHGEVMRGFDLRVSRRGGHIRSFALAGKLGAEAQVMGDLRGRGGGRNVIYVETSDAGALFRLTDTYPRIIGGSMSVAMDPPTTDNAPQEGLLNIYDFSVRGEPALEGVASSAPAPADARGITRSFAAGGGGVSFSRMRVEFTRSPGRFAIRDGVVKGPAVGGTIDGVLDYFRDEVRLRGTFVPAYGLNNMFSQVPIVGMFLGGGANEGLLGVTYQVVGSPHAPVLQVNPMSAIAPGFLRKIFEFRGAEDRTGTARPPEPIR